MKRTQLYLDDDLWQALHVKARGEGTTISELVRRAARERYLGKLDERRNAMQSFIGSASDRPEFGDPEEYVRNLRRGSRIDKLSKP